MFSLICHLKTSQFGFGRQQEAVNHPFCVAEQGGGPERAVIYPEHDGWGAAWCLLIQKETNI